MIECRVDIDIETNGSERQKVIIYLVIKQHLSLKMILFSIIRLRQPATPPIVILAKLQVVRSSAVDK